MNSTPLRDAHGEALSTTDRASVAAYDHALDLFNSFRLDPVAELTPALANEPGFVSGHLLMAGLMLSTFDGQLLGMARASLDAAEAGAARANPRERSLLAALRAWASGDARRASRLLERHGVDHPRDLLALQMAHLGDLLLGQSFLLRDRVARALGHWSPNDRGYGYLLGMHAFGLEECNEYARAEAVGRRAVELQPHDAWAVHAVAHVCEMQGRAADGIRWLETTQRHWAVDNGMAVHNHWHLALMHLGRGDTASAVALYDRTVTPAPEAVALNLNDASALLWRLQLRGANVDARWQGLAARWRQQAAWGGYGFNDLHALMALCAAGDDAGVADGLAALGAAARAEGASADLPIALAGGLAAQAFSQARYGHCAELLLPLLGANQSLGGSHAQRDLLHLTALEAASRAGDRALARALGDERAARKQPAAAPARREEALAA